MSNVYLEDGTAVPVLRFDIGVTVFDEQTGTVVFEGDVPDHLTVMGTDECAEWGTQWVDAAYGLPVVLQDDSDDMSTFGMAGQSYTEHYRAGARYSIGVCVIGKGKGFTVTHTNGAVDTYLTESEAMQASHYVYRAILGTTEVTL